MRTITGCFHRFWTRYSASRALKSIPAGKTHAHRLSEQAVNACCTWHAAGYGGRLGAVAREDFPISDAYPKFAPLPEELVRESQAAYGQDIDALGRAREITVLE